MFLVRITKNNTEEMVHVQNIDPAYKDVVPFQLLVNDPDLRWVTICTESGDIYTYEKAYE